MICDNISINQKGHLTFAGYDTVDLAQKYGTPLYLMDEEKIRQHIREYKKAFRGELTDEDEMYLTVEWYSIENDSYQTGTFYHTDLKYKPKNVANGKLMVECETINLHEY